MKKTSVTASRPDQETVPREHIFQTAIQLFAQHGFAGTGLWELANQADVNLEQSNNGRDHG